MTPPPERVTLPVLGERLDNALKLLAEVRTTQAVHTAQLSALDGLKAKVEAMESWQTWALRTVVALVIIAGVAAAATFVPT